MLGGAFNFLFDYFERCEIAFTERNSTLRLFLEYVDGKQYDICLKAI